MLLVSYSVNVLNMLFIVHYLDVLKLSWLRRKDFTFNLTYNDQRILAILTKTGSAGRNRSSFFCIF